MHAHAPLPRRTRRTNRLRRRNGVPIACVVVDEIPSIRVRSHTDPNRRRTRVGLKGKKDRVYRMETRGDFGWGLAMVVQGAWMDTQERRASMHDVWRVVEARRMRPRAVKRCTRQVWKPTGRVGNLAAVGEGEKHDLSSGRGTMAFPTTAQRFRRRAYQS